MFMSKTDNDDVIERMSVYIEISKDHYKYKIDNNTLEFVFTVYVNILDD